MTSQSTEQCNIDQTSHRQLPSLKQSQRSVTNAMVLKAVNFINTTNTYDVNSMIGAEQEIKPKKGVYPQLDMRTTTGLRDTGLIILL